MFFYNDHCIRACLFSLIFILLAQVANAQTKIGGTAGPGNASAVLELESTAQGFLPPRMSTTQRDAIPNPATGLTIYNITVNCLQMYKGAANGGWFDFCSGAGALSFTNCSTPVFTGNLNAQTPTTATVQISYINNTGQTFGVFVSGTANGITASAAGGTMPALTAGTGTITLTLSGIPATAGAMQLPVSIAGAVCNVPLTVGPFPGNIPVACGTAPGCTGGVDPATAVAGDKICWGGFEYRVISYNGRLWLDRNLGAQQSGTSGTKTYGDYYQWGRKGDGHQCTIYSNGGSGNGGSNPNSTTTSAAATGPDANNGGKYITISTDWINPGNSALWDSSATGGINNPCPLGFRVISISEYSTSFAASPTTAAAALAFTVPTWRDPTGSMRTMDGATRMWTASPATGTNAQVGFWNGSTWYAGQTAPRAQAMPVRCIKH